MKEYLLPDKPPPLLPYPERARPLFSEDTAYVNLNCVVHGVVVEGITRDQIEFEEMMHREEYGCLFDIYVDPSDRKIFS